jgi:hypothetical protein
MSRSAPAMLYVFVLRSRPGEALAALLAGKALRSSTFLA